MFNELTSKILLWLGIALLVLGIVLFGWNESLSFNKVIDSGKVGQFGDFVGGLVGAIWSLAGIILFYVALREQRVDLRTNQETLRIQTEALQQQIREFELQRQELQETKFVFKEQSETFKSQRFENTLFHLINFHHQTIEKLNFEEANHLTLEKDKYSQREVFFAASSKLSIRLRYSQKKQVKNRGGSSKYLEKEILSIDHANELFQEAYMEFHYLDLSQLLSHYFRGIYHIFKFIYLSELVPDEKKQFYASIVRAQLSSDELYLIFYNCLADGIGKPNFLFLAREFDIMQNFDFGLIEGKFHAELFERELSKAMPDWGGSKRTGDT